MNKIIQYVIGLAIAGLLVFIVVKMTSGDPPKRAIEPTPPATETVATPEPTVMHPPPSPAASSVDVPPIPPPPSIGLATAAYEAKVVSHAQAMLAAGKPQEALKDIEEYERIPERALLTPEATMVKIEALSKVGRRTDALALGMETRTDDGFKDYHGKVESILEDAGLIGQPLPPTPMP